MQHSAQSIKAAAARLAKEDGVSLNQWIAVAVAEKVGVTETAAEFLQRKAEGAQPSDLLVFLDRAADDFAPLDLAKTATVSPTRTT